MPGVIVAGSPLRCAMQQFRALAGRVARQVGLSQDGPWKPREDPVRGRRRALREEVGYWRDWLATGGGKWAEDYNYRFDPESEVDDPAIRDVLTRLAQERVSILDVGSGPVSGVGYRFPGTTLVLTAVDPLGREYNRLLDHHQPVCPAPRTEPLAGEQLLQHFGPDRFDVAYCRNALDHAVDPVLIVENMIGVVRPNGYVVLRHVRNEAVNQDYVQLHQWNLDERDGRFVIWRPGTEIDVSAALADRAETRCTFESDEDVKASGVVCVIRKLER
jgi:SAM-dependent methyltransferase